jgi:hypothetical protein
VAAAEHGQRRQDEGGGPQGSVDRSMCVL